jgi:polyisoprenoid-binding protein YceI
MIKETKWAIDLTHSTIEFKIRHLMISNVKCSFKTFDASIYTSGKDFTTAEIDLWIDASSISTGNEKRDEHLKNSDFLDVENHKQITFSASTMTEADKEGNQDLWGELTIKGITKNVKLIVELGGVANDSWGNEKAGFSVTGEIKRSDFGLNWNTYVETSGFLVSDEVKISCDIELINVSEKKVEMVLEPYSG